MNTKILDVSTPDEKAIELKRRGYMVTNTQGGLLVEKDTFWGHFVYDTSIGQNNSRAHFWRTFFLAFVYGVGLVGYVYWKLVSSANLKKEVISLVN